MAFATTNPVSVGGFTKKSDYDTVFDNTQELRGTSAYYNSAATQINTAYRYQVSSGNIVGTSIAAGATTSYSRLFISIPDTMILKVRRARWSYIGTSAETDLRLRIDYAVITGAGSSATKYTSSAHQGDEDINTTLCDNSGGGGVATGHIIVRVYNSHGSLSRTPSNQSSYWLDLVMYAS